MRLLIKSVCQRKTEQTLTTKAALKRELEQIAKRGYAFDAREAEEHMECVGAPVFDSDGKVLGAISVIQPVQTDRGLRSIGTGCQREGQGSIQINGLFR